MDREQVQEDARARGGEHQGAAGRLQLRRDERDLPHRLRGAAGEDRAGQVPEHHREHRDRPRLRGGGAAQAGLPLFYGSYPITPASDILHELATYKQFGVYTFQAEDEIAAIGAALGAAFGGAIGVTATSGPGICLKAETMGLAVMVELPLVIVDIQRGGPSTGLPTKTEQADLMLAMYGRHGESPAADPRGGDAGRLLRDGVRGGADRRPST